MKKIILYAALAAAALGCAKVESAPDMSQTKDIAVSVVVDNAGTKAVFDGENHIQFQSGDAFYAAVAKKETPTTGICVAKSQGAKATVYYSNFKIDDAEAESPSFSGNLYSIVEDDFAEEYNFYGIFPTSAVYSTSYLEDDLTEWLVKIPEEQEATQTAWSPKADAMVIQPTVISTSNQTFDQDYKEYTTTQANEKIKFAHVFGFGKVTFAGVPAEYASVPVKQIVIEAVGENKNFVGSFEIDITKNVEEMTPAPYSTSSTLTLKADGTIPVSEYVAWFVANPGTYDVRITVMTARADLIFERQGLNIRRSEIAAPVVNFKATDVTKSHNVVLENNEMWALPTFTTSSNCITSSYKEREWGPEGKKMVFSLTYPGTENNAGTSLWAATSLYYQQFIGNNPLEGGKAVLSSAASFVGVKKVKVALGNGTEGATNDFTVSLVNDEETLVLGKVTVTGSATLSPLPQESVVFATPEGKHTGDIVITADNFSVEKSKPYMASLIINPAPVITCDDAIKLEINEGSGELDLAISDAEGEPQVSDDADWLDVSYADGKLTYTYEANAGAKRTAVITISATGLTTATKTVTVSQKSATAIEYKLAFTAKDMYQFILEEKAKLEAEGKSVGQYDNYPVTATFTAVATNDSEKTVEVSVLADKINIYSSSENAFRNNGSLKCVNPVGTVTKMTCSADQKFSTSIFSGMTAYLSVNGTDWVKMTDFTTEGSAAPYLNSVENENEDYIYFDFKGNTIVNFSSVEVTFIAD